MTAPWEETTLTIILARYQLNHIFNADEFGLFYEALPSEVTIFQVEKTAKCGEQAWMRLKPLVRKSRCLWLKDLPVQDASSVFVTSLADIDLKRKHGWMGHFLRNVCTRSIVSSEWKQERLLWLSIITLPIQNFQDGKLSIYSFCHQIPLPCTQQMDQDVIRCVCFIIFLFY